MMKKAVAALLVFVVIIFNAAPGYCETPAFRKFRRGFCNMLTFHMEIGQQMEAVGDAHGNGWAVTVGLTRGILMSAARLLTGVYETVTFPVPFPAEYKPIMKKPEFFWTEPFAEAPGK
ncbi:MAG: exosortase system-associated protein, TIGR04073 family [Candidatus Omnitrophica bacterium]|nr:exosortase system-associated protein, TIGR04073 family [Candidatus Omnitrophota bacterium]